MKIACLIIILVFSACTLGAVAVQPEGEGTEASPYIVATLDNLQWISENSSSWESWFIQTTDIDASDTQNWNDGAGFNPIGDYDNNNYERNFSGVFNGNDHTIENLFIYRPQQNEIGFFGRTEAATIQNVRLLNVSVTGNEDVGGLAGISYSNIVNCHCSGSVSGTFCFGGLIGSNLSETGNSSTTVRCSSTCFVSGNDIDSRYAGGLLGYNKGIVSNCYSNASIIGAGVLGGFVGRNVGTWGSIINCYSLSNVTCISATGTSIGGFVGYNDGGISNCYSTGCVEYGEVVQTDKGFCGLFEDGAMSGNYWDIETSGATSTAGIAQGRTTNEMTYPYGTNTYTDWDFVNIWQSDINHQFNNGYPFLGNMPAVEIDDEILTAIYPLGMKNYPNPFNPSTTISYSIQKAGWVQLSVYNIKGQLVRTLIEETQSAGTHSINWNGTDNNGRAMASGVYFGSISAKGNHETRKMLLMK